MKKSRKLGRGLAAAGAIAALSAGAFTAAAPASAATAMQGDRLVGPLITNGGAYVFNQPVAANYKVAPSSPSAALDWWDSATTKATFSRPAAGTTGPFILENTGKCLQANGATSVSWAVCNGSLAQDFTANRVSDSYDTFGNKRYSTSYITHPIDMGTSTGLALQVTPANLAQWDIGGLMELPVERDVLVTSPAPSDVVGTSGVTYTGTATANATVAVTDESGREIGSTTSDDNGDWTFDTVLPEGPATLTFSTATKSTTVTVMVIDDSAFLVVTAPADGSKVSTKGVVFAGTGQPGETITLTDGDGSRIGSPVLIDGTGAWSITTDLAEGTHALVFTAGTRSTSVSVEAVALTLSSPTAGTTMDASGTVFEGTGLPGETVQITDAGGAVVAETTIAADGSWTAVVTVPAGSAELTITAGNQEVTFGAAVADYTRSLATPADRATITPDTVFSGTGAEGEKVTIKDKDGTILGSATIGADGTWSTTLSPAPANGSIDLVIEFTDSDGKTDVFAENNYEMTGSDEARAFAGPAAGTDITPDTAFTGTGRDGDVVTITDSAGTVLGTATVGADGQWSTTLNPAPVNGATDLVITITGADNVTDQLATGSYTMTGSEEPSSYTGPTSGNVTPDTAYTGTGAKGETVTLTDKAGNVLGTTTIGEDGKWSTTLDPAPNNGPLDLTVTIGDLKVADVTVTMTGSNEARALTSPEPGSKITPDTEFSGTGNIGDTVKVKDKDGNVLGETTVGNDGKWSTTLSPAPDNGNIDLVIEITGKDNKTEELANGSYEMTDLTTKFQVLTPNLEETNNIPNGTVFTGTGEPGTTVVITDKDGNAVGDAVVDSEGNWSTPITGLEEGDNSLKLTYIAPGEEQVTIDLGPIVVVTDDAGIPVMDPALAGGFGMILLAAVGAYAGLRRRRVATQQ
ncbi:Ig-like domain-containing protein [Leifsonia aquatica]|uniref:Ig-like domain-containing protein n=1 Tax=Leifsonia aquatica TaxID=144185 RepID=UPI000A648D3B|nr:Ig-like domain-containing protein [Leifsonia aquatica]